MRGARTPPRSTFRSPTPASVFRPIAAPCGSDALDAMANGAREDDPFRLVLVDANMPVMDGFSVATALKERTDRGSATIMMLSSSGLDTDVRRCREIGIDAYLT